MKRLAFALGVLALGAVTPARADFAVVEFNSGYCRVWTDTEAGPQDGHYLWFRHHWGWHPWYYRFHTWEEADEALHRAVSMNRCHHGLATG